MPKPPLLGDAIKPNLRNYKTAERYVLAIEDAAERQWLQAILFHLLLVNAHQNQPMYDYEYDCDALYVMHAMQGLWRRPGILAAIAQGIILPPDFPDDDI